MARPIARPRAAWAVCIDLISAWSGPRRLIAPMPSRQPESRKLKKVTAGSRRVRIQREAVLRRGLPERERPVPFQ